MKLTVLQSCFILADSSDNVLVFEFLTKNSRSVWNFPFMKLNFSSLWQGYGGGGTAGSGSPGVTIVEIIGA